MPAVAQHAPGTFCWFELATTDAAKAKAFYGGLFGWKFKDNPMPQGVYTVFQAGDMDVSAMHPMTPEMQKQGIPPHWMTYVAVASVDDSVAKARALGGTTVAGPFDVMDLGRMAVIMEPGGATFSLWEARQQQGVGVENDPGSVCWRELGSRNLEASRKFYCGLFGWGTKSMDMGPGGMYTIFTHAGKSVGGMYAMTPEMGAVPPHWLVYYAVSDCDATVQKAGALGGGVVVPPREVPTVGRFAVLRDGQGAGFAVIKLAPPA